MNPVPGHSRCPFFRMLRMNSCYLFSPQDRMNNRYLFSSHDPEEQLQQSPQHFPRLFPVTIFRTASAQAAPITTINITSTKFKTVSSLSGPVLRRPSYVGPSPPTLSLRPPYSVRLMSGRLLRPFLCVRLTPSISTSVSSPVSLRTPPSVRFPGRFWTVSHPRNSRPITVTTKAAIQATTHCQMTTPQAQRLPISRRIEATAATQGV